ncbi:MAG: DoxX family protein [Flavitalea sp.]
MKKLLSTKYSASAFNIAMLILRIGLGGLMMPHGYDKLVHFATYEKDFMNFLGIGSSLSLALVVFSEFFCSLFLVVGLFSRLIVIPMIFGLCIALFKAHNGDIFGDGEHAALFITGLLVILLVGPGKISADGMMGT